MALAAHNLVKSYRGRRVVDEVGLDVERGEIVGLLGPNGAGKTTTFYMMVGLIRPGGGSVSLNGRDVTHVPMYQRARAGIGYLPQEPSIFRRLTVEQNLFAVLEHQGLGASERRGRAEALMEEFAIGHLRQVMGYQVSGGERRRVEIARALASEPQFVLLDEPFTGVDPIAVDNIQQIIAHLRERGIGILLTDHSVRETLAVTDRAYIIFEGKILTAGASDVLPEDAIAKKFYLGERFSL
jgi:lipopolysaccharide export system ATP-binding protein